MTKRRSPWLLAVTALVYVFLYAPIIVLVVFAFNSSRTNVVFEGVAARYSMVLTNALASPSGSLT